MRMWPVFRAWVTCLLAEAGAESGFAAVVNLADGSEDFAAFRQTSQSGLVLMMENNSPLRRLEPAPTESDEGGATTGKASGATLPLICAAMVASAILVSFSPYSGANSAAPHSVLNRVTEVVKDLKDLFGTLIPAS